MPLLAALVGVGFAVAGCDDSSGRRAQSGNRGMQLYQDLRDADEAVAATGTRGPAPTWTLPDIHDAELMRSLHDYRGRWVLLDFWATW